jgi:hypothetical protein
VIDKFVGVRGKEHAMYKIVTPAVRAEAEAQFNCPGVDGVDLDYSDDEKKIPGNHWDKRVMFNDYMVSQSENKRDVIYSRITLAALEDTGWYDVNMSLGDNVTWGRDKSCFFLTEKCITEKFKPLSSEFCVDTDYVSSCNHDHTHKGVCSMTRYHTPVPTDF